MKEFFKKNFVVLLAFILPVLLILVVASSVYLPRLFVSTDYNFVYISCVEDNDYYYRHNCNSYLQQRYSVVGNKLVANKIDENQDLDKNNVPDVKENFNYSTRIFLHNTEDNESREITLEEAQNLTLSSLITSPDGVTVSNNYNSGDYYFFPFGGSSSSYGYYLVKGKGKVKLNLINTSDRYYYQNNFQFIGWVLTPKNN